MNTIPKKSRFFLLLALAFFVPLSVSIYLLPSSWILIDVVRTKVLNSTTNSGTYLERKTEGVAVTDSNKLKTETSGEDCSIAYDLEYLFYPQGSSFDTPNNKFGLYIYAEVEKYFDYADKLVNFNGGDWGYVLIPFNIKDRDSSKWRRVFENLNTHHLIPIVQLWGLNPEKYERDTKDSAEFLNTFVWPVKERYISVYNEPNDTKFWGTAPDPKKYAEILDYTINIFQKENSNFFMMNGALNSSAPDHSGYMSSERFLQLMDQAKPGIFDKLDGWASHPYPQPNFSGSVYATGWWSIQAYESELKFLKDGLRVKKELPVFITETGWTHAEGSSYNASFYNAEIVANLFEIAFRDIWLKDDRVRAVTPFTVYYEPPFDHFSWVTKDGEKYPQFDAIKAMKKVGGEPVTIEKSQLTVTGCKK